MMIQTIAIPDSVERVQRKPGFFRKMLDGTISTMKNINYYFDSSTEVARASSPGMHIARRRLENGEYFDKQQEIKYAEKIRGKLFAQRRKFMFWHSEEGEYRITMFAVPFEIMRKVELSKEAQKVFLEIYKEDVALFKMPADIIKIFSECRITAPELITALVDDLLAAEKRGDRETKWTQWDGSFFDAEGRFYDEDYDWGGIAYRILLNSRALFDEESQFGLVQMLIRHETAKGAGEKATVLLQEGKMCEEAAELLRQAVSKAALNVPWVRFTGRKGRSN